MRLAAWLTDELDRLDTLEEGFIRLSRLCAFAVLHERTLARKNSWAAAAELYASSAAQIDGFLRNHFHVREAIVEWPADCRPHVMAIPAAGGDALESLNDAVRDLLARAATHAHRLLVELEGIPILAPAARLVAGLTRILPTHDGAVGLSVQRLLRTRLGGPQKVLVGPPCVHLDPVFLPAYSLLDHPRPTFGGPAFETAAYFWSLSAQESLAAELCALSAAEYDRLPVSFYIDMARQCWDESRHAVCYLKVATELLGDPRTAIPEQHAYAVAVRKFLATGVGLPIPTERNFYEAIWNADLIERFVLMHHDSEAPGIPRKRGMLESEFSQSHENVRLALSVDLCDEISHAQIGRKWLRYLLPDDVARQAAIRNTRALRPVLLLTSAVQHNGGSLPELARHLASPDGGQHIGLAT